MRSTIFVGSRFKRPCWIHDALPRIVWRSQPVNATSPTDPEHLSPTVFLFIATVNSSPGCRLIVHYAGKANFSLFWRCSCQCDVKGISQSQGSSCVFAQEFHSLWIELVIVAPKLGHMDQPVYWLVEQLDKHSKFSDSTDASLKHPSDLIRHKLRFITGTDRPFCTLRTTLSRRAVHTDVCKFVIRSVYVC